MAASRAPEAAGESAILQQVLAELGYVRRGIEGLAARMGEIERELAGHPPSGDLRAHLARVAVLEAAAIDRARRLADLEVECRALRTDVGSLRESRATAGVTITGVHKVAAAALGLITLALVALVGYLWRR